MRRGGDCHEDARESRRSRAIIIALGGLVQSRAADQAATITGEVIDTYCYASMGAKGESHRQCGLDCVKKGIAVGLLEDKTSKVYTLLPSKDKTPVPDAVVQKMGRTATVTGKVYTSGGSQFLTVETVK